MVVKLTKGGSCIISGEDNDEEEWIMETTHLIQVGHFGGHFFTFLDGKFYVPGFRHDHVSQHTWTLTP